MFFSVIASQIIAVSKPSCNKSTRIIMSASNLKPQAATIPKDIAHIASSADSVEPSVHGNANSQSSCATRTMSTRRLSFCRPRSYEIDTRFFLSGLLVDISGGTSYPAFDGIRRTAGNVRSASMLERAYPACILFSEVLPFGFTTG